MTTGATQPSAASRATTRAMKTIPTRTLQIAAACLSVAAALTGPFVLLPGAAVAALSAAVLGLAVLRQPAPATNGPAHPRGDAGPAVPRREHEAWPDSAEAMQAPPRLRPRRPSSTRRRHRRRRPESGPRVCSACSAGATGRTSAGPPVSGRPQSRPRSSSPGSSTTSCRVTGPRSDIELQRPLEAVEFAFPTTKRPEKTQAVWSVSGADGTRRSRAGGHDVGWEVVDADRFADPVVVDPIGQQECGVLAAGRCGEQGGVGHCGVGGGNK